MYTTTHTCNTTRTTTTTNGTRNPNKHNIFTFIILITLFLQLQLNYIGINIIIVNAKKSIPCTKKNNYNTFYSTIHSNHHHDNQNIEEIEEDIQWNPSPNIDENGFLKHKYRRILGEWEIESNIGGKYGYKSKNSRDIETTTVIVRQVPGDGNCLFHSLSVGLNYVERKKHFYMKNSILSSSMSLDHQQKKKMKKSTKHQPSLHEKSTLLRQIAVDMLTPLSSSSHENDNNEHNSNPKRKRHRQRPLFIQGNEYLHRDDLLHIAGSQYDLSGHEYCNIMRKNGVWGGGPEIVALCNYLKRPIHVYELVTVHPPPKIITRKATTTAKPTGTSEKRSIRLQLFRDSLLTLYRGIWKMNNPIDKACSSKLRISKLCEGSKPEFRLRRMACFGSPKFDDKEPIHILSADCRFPDLKPGQEAANGNHFLAIFPMKKGRLNSSSLGKSLPKQQVGVKIRSGASKCADTKECFNHKRFLSFYKGRPTQRIKEKERGKIAKEGRIKQLYNWLEIPTYVSLFDEWIRMKKARKS